MHHTLQNGILFRSKEICELTNDASMHGEMCITCRTGSGATCMAVLVLAFDRTCILLRSICIVDKED